MNKTELAHAIGARTDVPWQQALLFLDTMQDVVTEELLADRRVVLYSWMTFETVTSKPMRRFVPKRNINVDVPARITPKIRTSSAFRRRFAGKPVS